MNIIVSQKSRQDIIRVIRESADLVDTRGYISVPLLSDRFNKDKEPHQQFHLVNFGKALKAVGFTTKKTVKGSMLVYPVDTATGLDLLNA